MPQLARPGMCFFEPSFYRHASGVRRVSFDACTHTDGVGVKRVLDQTKKSGSNSAVGSTA